MIGLEIADVVGTIAFALSGFMVATKDRLDLLGIFIASFLTALGGGILRDTVADRVPFAFSHLLPMSLVICVILFAILFKLYKKSEIENKMYFVISDSIGLVSFSITGALVGLMVDFNIFGVVLLALATAVGGGIMRDTLLNRVPVVLTSELYGSVAIIVGIFVFMLDCFDEVHYITLLAVFCLGLSLRLIAYHKRWHLPKLG
ncbi:trimeric intracellular cation channel family protein [Sulfurospirillum arcachonense]|uniref:trimeric intracellular cation channel family protein n=1 Tax=Sulfurospirillum arcachonense TaxID=57666 RepID=UPI000469AC71|nr:TRIC cation channel family protein [Sulfurospirillum arcachonense]